MLVNKELKLTIDFLSGNIRSITGSVIFISGNFYRPYIIENKSDVNIIT